VCYLAAQLEVDHDDGDLWHGDDQDDKDKEQEAKQVVELVLPDGLQHQQCQAVRGQAQASNSWHVYNTWKTIYNE